MNTLLFLVVACGMATALGGHRRASLLMFLAGLAGAAFWLAHHATGTLPLEF